MDAKENLIGVLREHGNVVLSFTPKKGPKLGDSYDVLLGSNEKVKSVLTQHGFHFGGLYGSEKCIKVSSRELYELLNAQGVGQIEIRDREVEAKVKQEKLRADILSNPKITTGKTKRIRKAGDTTVRCPRVKRYVEKRTIIVPENQCEMCEEVSKHRTKRGKYTDFDVHHLEGVEISDTIYTSVRACALCHNAVTRKATDGKEINDKAKQKVFLAETTKRGIIHLTPQSLSDTIESVRDSE